MAVGSEAVAVANTVGEEVLIAPGVIQELPNGTALHVFSKDGRGIEDLWARQHIRDYTHVFSRIARRRIGWSGLDARGKAGRSSVLAQQGGFDLFTTISSCGNAQNRIWIMLYSNRRVAGLKCTWLLWLGVVGLGGVVEGGKVRELSKPAGCLCSPSIREL
jgi:hypothetical protein